MDAANTTDQVKAALLSDKLTDAVNRIVHSPSALNPICSDLADQVDQAGPATPPLPLSLTQKPGEVEHLSALWF